MRVTLSARFPYALTQGLNLTGSGFRVILLSDTYSPSRAHHWRSDVVGHEVTGTGYTAGGKAITLAAAFEAPEGRTLVTRPYIEWTAASITARFLALCYVRGGAATADELLWTEQFQVPFTTVASTFPINPSVVEFLL